MQVGIPVAAREASLVEIDAGIATGIPNYI